MKKHAEDHKNVNLFVNAKDYEQVRKMLHPLPISFVFDVFMKLVIRSKQSGFKDIVEGMFDVDNLLKGMKKK
jgi:hypothetical protein